MGLGPTNSDENARGCDSVDWRGTEEVDTALDELRPSGSLIRNARFEPINVMLPFLAGRA